jgi:hypothetical protein
LNTSLYPQIAWRAGTPADLDARGDLEPFDIAFLLEVLQYMSFADVMDVLWRRLAPGGRIVAIFPNENCPIVSATSARFSARYAPPSLCAIVETIARMRDVETHRFRGLAFAADQRIAPYELSTWRTEPVWATAPNRIQLVVAKTDQRRGGGSAGQPVRR